MSRVFIFFVCNCNTRWYFMLLNKRSHLYAFLFMKCPHCHHGNMFEKQNPYALAYLSKMPLQCPICKQPYVLETGFYWGAMYVSYGLTIFFSMINVAVLLFVFKRGMYGLVFWNAGLLILMFPLFFRYSRVLWLQVNVRFSPDAFRLTEDGDKT